MKERRWDMQHRYVNTPFKTIIFLFYIPPEVNFNVVQQLPIICINYQLLIMFMIT